MHPHHVSCDNDVASSKPASAGRDTTETTQDTDAVANQCGKNRSKTCKHMVEGFCSNTTGKIYAIKSLEAVMPCATKECNLSD